MMLLISAFVASLDGFVIGMGLRGLHIKLTYQDFFILFLENLFLYSILLFFYSFFHFHFITNFISTLLYLLLSFFALKHKEEEVSIIFKKLNVLSCFFLTLTHSLDGSLVSLGFVYEYSIWLIVFLFSFMAVLLIVFGYLFSKSFRVSKKSNYISAFLFFLLAILNQFF